MKPGAKSNVQRLLLLLFHLVGFQVFCSADVSFGWSNNNNN